jgi:hypothetical protein
MKRNTDLGTLTPDQRLAEIARILAAATLRLCRRGSRPSSTQRSGD